MSKDCLDVVSAIRGTDPLRPSQPPKRKVFIQLSQLRCQPCRNCPDRTERPFSCQQLRGEPEAQSPVAKTVVPVKTTVSRLECAARCGNAQQGDEETGKKGRVEADGRDSVGF